MSSFQRYFLRLFHCRTSRRGPIMPHVLNPLLMIAARAAHRLRLAQGVGSRYRLLASLTTQLTRRLPHYPHTSLAAPRVAEK